MKKLLNNRLFIGVTAIIIALLISFVSAPIVELFTSSNTEVIRAKIFIKQGTKITSDMIEKVSVGKFNLPSDIISLPQDALEKFAAVDISPNDFVSVSKISETSGEFAYLSKLADGKLAMSIDVSTSAMSVSGKLRENDIISIFSDAPDIDFETDNLTVDEVLTARAASALGLAYEELKCVKVLAVVNGIDKDIRLYEKTDVIDGNANTNAITTIVLEVNPRQAQLIAGINDKKLHCALISRGNEEKAKQLLELQDAFFAEK